MPNYDYQIQNRDLYPDGTLKYVYPDKISGSFYCDTINITSLKGCPREVGGYFSCFRTPLTSLEHAPLIIHAGVSLTNNPKLESLEGIGRKYFKQIGEKLDVSNTIKSNILGVILIKDLLEFRIFPNKKELTDIINAHLSGDRDILECQEELIDKGFKQYAKL